VVAAPTFPELFDDILGVTAGRKGVGLQRSIRQGVLAGRCATAPQECRASWGPRHMGMCMRARSAWAGTPDHFYQLDAGHGALGDAIAALNVLQTIANDSGLDQLTGPNASERGPTTPLRDLLRNRLSRDW